MCSNSWFLAMLVLVDILDVGRLRGWVCDVSDIRYAGHLSVVGICG